MTKELTIAERLQDSTVLETVKETCCKGATPAQFRMFVEIAKATGLNPFLKEIWFVPGVGVMAGRDGYLRVANEHPQFDGMETLVERDAQGIPVKATCKVWRKDRSHPITCEAYYNEYKKTSSVWVTYKSAMIGKVAEVLALKRSFSINGVVTEEEIGEQRESGKAAAQEVAERKISEMKKAKVPRAVEAALGVSECDIIDAQTEEPPTELERTLEKSIEQAQANKDPEPDKFVALGRFADLKINIIAETGNDQLYYQGLAEAGYKKSNEIRSDDLRRAYRCVAGAFTTWKKQQAPIEEGE